MAVVVVKVKGGARTTTKKVKRNECAFKIVCGSSYPLSFLYKQAVIVEADDDENEIPFSTKNYPLVAGLSLNYANMHSSSEQNKSNSKNNETD